MGETEFEKWMIMMMESILEDNRKWREKWKVPEDKNMEQVSPEPEDDEERKDNDKPAIEEVPKDETTEELQPEDEVEQAEKEGDSNTLLTENEFDRNQGDIHLSLIHICLGLVKTYRLYWNFALTTCIGSQFGNLLRYLSCTRFPLTNGFSFLS